MEIYQDIFSNGEVIRSGTRECGSRYDAIHGVLSKYERKFTMLDIGANFGYFSIRASSDFDCTSIMIQSNPESNVILDLCSKNSSLNLNLINTRISPSEIRSLSKCERFDVVLLLNVLHHLGINWQVAVESCLRMANTVIIETPPVNDSGSCGKQYLAGIVDFINSKKHKVIGEFSRHTDPHLKSKMVEISGYPDVRLEKSFIDMPSIQKQRMGEINIDYDFKQKKITKNKKEQEWVHGMNLYNFIKLNGAWPTKEMLISDLKKKKINTNYKWDNSHRDITPWNFILNGSELNLIDLDGFNYNQGHTLDKDGLNFTINKIKSS